MAIIEAHTEQLTVMIIEDEPSLSFAFEATLEAEGYQVVTAMNGIDALSLLERDDFERGYDAAILDLRMPGMDGLELMERIYKQGRRLPVVLTSAHMDNTTIAKAAFYGVTDYLKKPTIPKQLRDAVAKLIADEAKYERIEFPDVSSTRDPIGLVKWYLRRGMVAEALQTAEVAKANNAQPGIAYWYLICSHLLSIDRKDPVFASDNFYLQTDLLDRLAIN